MDASEKDASEKGDETYMRMALEEAELAAKAKAAEASKPEKSFCENCGAKLTEGAAFCENCGAKIE